jgi:hypothetical protein
VEKVPYVKSSSLKFNSVNVIDEYNNYFNYVQQYSYYNSTPDVGVNMYSFSLHPCDTQPSGSCNFGRIPFVSLSFEFNEKSTTDVITNQFYEIADEELLNQFIVRVYAVNYNVLRILGGICGIAYQYA